MAGHRWLDMFPDEFFEELKRCPVCYMSYGPAEPHGVYSAMGVDYYNADLLAERAARTYGGVVAPASAWHIQEQQYYDWERDCCGMGLSLTTSVPEELFLHNMLYHVRNMDAKGFHAGVLLSGHYLGDLSADMRLLCEFYVMRTGSPMRFWAGCINELVPDMQDKLGLPPNADEHAGLMETSMVMALNPRGVDMGRLTGPLNIPASLAGGGEGYGPYCAPERFGRSLPPPTSDLGERMVALLLEELGRRQERLLRDYRPGQTPRRQVSLCETEAVWAQFVMLTRKYWQCVLTRREAEEGISLPFPGWKEIGEVPIVL